MDQLIDDTVRCNFLRYVAEEFVPYDLYHWEALPGGYRLGVSLLSEKLDPSWDEDLVPQSHVSSWQDGHWMHSQCEPLWCLSLQEWQVCRSGIMD